MTNQDLQAENIRLRQRIEALRAALRSAMDDATRALNEDYALAARSIFEAIPGKAEDALLEDDNRAGHVF